MSRRTRGPTNHGRHPPQPDLSTASSTTIAAWLQKTLPLSRIRDDVSQQLWENVGYRLTDSNRPSEGLDVFSTLYRRLFAYEATAHQRLYKGRALLGISRACELLKRRTDARRFAMLALCEEAVLTNGSVDPQSGAYARALKLGLTATEIRMHARSAYQHFTRSDAENARFPEWLLQQLPDEWAADIPSAEEMTTSLVNPTYVRRLLTWTDQDRTGHALEYLGQYLFSVLPGCRVKRRTITQSTEVDLFCCLNGPTVDFRGDLGRYFICEAKNWHRPADVDALTKFAQMLALMKCGFGVLFSRQGLTGMRTFKAAHRIQVQLAQRGPYIIVISRADLETVARGEDFLAMVRRKYEDLRFDLQPDSDEG